MLDPADVIPLPLILPLLHYNRILANRNAGQYDCAHANPCITNEAQSMETSSYWLLPIPSSFMAVS